MAFWNRRKGRHKDGNGTADSPTIGQGIWYLYLIIIIQVAFVFGLMTVIITLGKVLATPLWVFIAAFAIGASGCAYIYHKAKAQFRRFSATLQRTDLSDRNYEISFMGGMLTMRVEKSPHRLLESKPATVIDAETVESTAAH